MARSTEDCQNAAQAILSFATNRAAAAKGTYTLVNPGSSDVWPGDVLALNENGSTTDVVVRGVTIAEHGASPETLTYRIAFANDWAEGLGITLSEAIARDAILPQTAQAYAPGSPWARSRESRATQQSSPPAPLSPSMPEPHRPPAAASRSAVTMEASASAQPAPPAETSSCAGPVRGFSIPRAAANEIFYLRMYDASTPPLYSRVSAAIATQLPLS